MGFARFIFASLVLVSHLADSIYVDHLGHYAVRAFFVLSGFVITLALNEAYSFDGLKFWANRLLRLLPPYYLVASLTFIAIALDKESAGWFCDFWRGSLDDGSFLANLFILPQQFNVSGMRYLPQYWSVAVELVMYAALYCFVARGAIFAILGLALGALYHLIVWKSGFSWEARYFAAPSALFAFSLGASIYFATQSGAIRSSWRAGMLALLFWFIVALLADVLLPSSNMFESTYYGCTILAAVAVVGLHCGPTNGWLRDLDRFVGKLAYPLFLVQFLAGYTAVRIFDLSHPRGWDVVMATLPIAIGMAIALAWINELVIEPLRTEVRRSGQFNHNSSNPESVGVGSRPSSRR